MQSGELVVVGQDHIKISLDAVPSATHAHFKDEENIVPCNVHHADTLEWEVEISPHTNAISLLIKWNVSGKREIKWQADY